DRARIAARGNLCVERLRLAERKIAPKGYDSIQTAVETRDALKHPLDKLTGRNAARPHRVGEHAEHCPPPAGPDRNEPSRPSPRPLPAQPERTRNNHPLARRDAR